MIKRMKVMGRRAVRDLSRFIGVELAGEESPVTSTGVEFDI